MRFMTTTTPAGRLEYLLLNILLTGLFFGATILTLAPTGGQIDLADPIANPTDNPDFSFTAANLGIWTIAVFMIAVVSIITVLRRIKDIGYSNYSIFLLLVPFVNVVFSVWLLVRRGQRGLTAPYGKDPYDPASWMEKPKGTAESKAVVYQGQSLLLPGEEGWGDGSKAA